MTLLSDLLYQLGVPHTGDYTDKRFAEMPFKSLYGLTKVLQEYGVGSEGLKLNDKNEILKLQTPFLADTQKGFLIVTQITPTTVDYLSQGVAETMSTEELVNASNGIVLLVYPDEKSLEPNYGSHRRVELINYAKRWVLAVGLVAILAYFFATRGLWRQWSTMALTAIMLGGFWLTLMLVRKSLNIKSRAADRVCAVLQEGGCDKVLEMKASSFFGIFSWSEVGLAYFSISLLTLLVFPEWTRYLAACNVLCLPFTLWSIWYQKFRAKHWCTLCVSVQLSLWLMFFCFLFGGWLHGIFPLRLEFFALGAGYVTALMGLNQILPHFNRKNNVIEPYAPTGSDDVTPSTDAKTETNSKTAA